MAKVKRPKNNFGTRPYAAVAAAGRLGGRASPQRGRFATVPGAAREAALKRVAAARQRRLEATGRATPGICGDG
jgi:hypothetical protein